MNILPPLMTVWWHFAKRSIADRTDIVIFDCSGKLHQVDFPGARVQKFLNFYASTKCDEFLYHIARKRRIGWMCDDDMFLLSPKCVDVLQREFADPQVASVSFRPRVWWEFEIEGKRHTVSSSYCTAINREIFCSKEHLSLAPVQGNPHPATEQRQPKSFDTFDKANEELLKKGYKCVILPEDEQRECVTGYSGMSNGVMLLNYFKTPEQMVEFFLTPPKKQWQGTVLHDAFSAILAIDAIQKIATEIRGEEYPLPSLPGTKVLQEIRSKHEPLLREGKSWKWIDDVTAKLRAHL